MRNRRISSHVLLQVESVHFDDLLVGDCADLDAGEHRVWSRVCSQILRKKRSAVIEPVRHSLLWLEEKKSV